MAFQSFIDDIINTIRPAFCADTEFKEETILKNNGQKLKALIISEPGNNIFPTIYLEDYFSRFNDGESIDSISNDIISAYKHYKIEGEIDVSCFRDFEKMKNRIVMRLVNKEKNGDLLINVPWVPFLDLAIIFTIYFETPSEIYAGTIIHNNHMEDWNTSVDELFELSKANSVKLLPCNLRSMPDFLNDMVGDVIVDNSDMKNYMYVLTNSTKTHGAACMAYKDVIDDFATKMESDLFVLPSSIHEVMLLCDNDDLSLKDLTELVHEVNTTQVSEGEYLSDHAYFYKRKSKEFVY